MFWIGLYQRRRIGMYEETLEICICYNAYLFEFTSFQLRLCQLEMGTDLVMNQGFIEEICELAISASIITCIILRPTR